ncbi:ATP-dependent rRNA helicase-like protein spb4 [Sporormia fimetaria CBS 119925]|uniref:ATP-dependent RNA helicase n=1 Tax=Sporormia fimetaria CBS 119925 TaxID=1340428 RepID=A0A6A6VI25_9PLEO|nr:ATP-dependent rRNA helicase-like protein spb4 [Sporormia fimetaria CBS 119925]
MAPDAKAEAQRQRQWEALTPSLSEWILDATRAMGFTKTTPVQQAAIPLFMGNKDVVVEAVTGSGKTLSFLIPIVERLLRLDAPIKKHHVGAIIISPTRELATQIHTVLVSLLKFHGPSAAALWAAEEDDAEMPDADAPAPPSFPPSTLKVVPQLLLGGAVTPAQDLSKFLKRSPNILIGTPGRLLELLSSPHVHCPQSSFDALVLDEADRLLDLGFKEDLQRILSRLPKQRRTGLFSASVSEAVDQLVRVGLRNPVRIAVKVKARANGEQGKIEDKRTPASLHMSYLVMPPHHKLPAIQKLLETLKPQPQKTIFYLATCYSVDYFQHVLPVILEGFTIVPLHGKHPDKVRRKNFSRFVDSVSPSILLTTDVAARGLDIPSVDLVLQMDPPSDPKTFIHRCGRAGRAGRKGLAVTFLNPGREEDYIEFLRVRQTPISPLTSPPIEVTPVDADLVAMRIRDVVKSDRAIFDKAQRGFVSWVRAYSKHTASSIFRVTDLEWDQLGQAWGLLKLPSMPELKKWEGDRSLGVEMDFSTYAYKDKVREQQRLAELSGEVAGNTEAKHLKKKDRIEAAWTQKKDQRATKELRRDKKKAKREHERVTKLSDEERKKEEELKKMIETVRKQTAEDEANEFEGFSD